jgi:hypothetical protein
MDSLVKITLSIVLCTLITASASPPHGGEKHHYDKSAVARELPSREREVRLNHGIAECVRTAWIGDTNNRKLICVEYRYRKESK